MHKSTLSILALLILLAGCAAQKEQPLPPASCPKVSLPALDKLPDDVINPGFLDRLESRMFGKPSEPTSYELRSSPAMQAMTGRGLKLPSE